MTRAPSGRLALVAFAVAAWFHVDGVVPAADVRATNPRAIAGGLFEASGVVQVRGTNQLLFVARENLRVDGATIRVQLNGAGIRGLEYDEHAAAFRLITGAGGNEESRDFRVMEWDGLSGTPLRDVVSFSRRLKPEGIARTVLGGRQVSVIVFDVGSFVVLK